MGCSVSSQKRIVKSQSSSIQFTYPRSVSLVILDHISKLPICQFFTVTEPLISISKSLKISDVPVYLSFSVLPGQDPHGNYLKICQDACMETNDENSLLMCLFDGHGKKGEEVANFCCNSAQELYNILKDRHVVNFYLGQPFELLA